ncbi:MAG: oxidoreductase [Armatimonadota bacterium]
MYESLFQPIQVRGKTIRNRIVMPPMVTNMGLVTDQAVAWYAERAKGGVGLVIVESTPLERLREPHIREGLPRLADAAHSAGALIAMQVFFSPTVDGRPVSVSGTDEAPAISAEQIRAKAEQFAESAALLRACGFDGMEPHGAHGFFLNQFFSPRHNRRQDEFGGSLEGRMQTGLSIVSAIRKAVGSDFIVLYRHTPDEQAPDGYGLEDSIVFAERLAQAGVDILDISPSTRAGSDNHAGMAAAIRRVVSVPVIAVGGMKDPAAASAAIEQGKCDLVAVGRGLIAEPHWVSKVREGRLNEITWCVECNERCFGHLREGIPIGCKVNLNAGREYLRG